jgi:hypothetical protein
MQKRLLTIQVGSKTNKDPKEIRSQKCEIPGKIPLMIQSSKSPNVNSPFYGMRERLHGWCLCDEMITQVDCILP